VDAVAELSDGGHEGSWQPYYSRVRELRLGLGRVDIGRLDLGGDSQSEDPSHYAGVLAWDVLHPTPGQGESQEPVEGPCRAPSAGRRAKEPTTRVGKGQGLGGGTGGAATRPG
jgi:hypothetical protein